MEKTWQLQHTQSLNQMLRVRENLEAKEGFDTLMIVKHSYHIADDIMFPDPACLAFFAAFEEQHLEKYDDMILSAVDIFEGEMKFYIYCKDGQKSVHDCIEYLKSNANFGVEFELKADNHWQVFKSLGQ